MLMKPSRITGGLLEKKGFTPKKSDPGWITQIFLSSARTSTRKTIKNLFGEPEYIKDITNISSGGLCFKPENVSNNQDPYFLLEPLQDDLKFENDNFIQDLIKEQKFNDNVEMSRDKCRKLIEEENKNQKKLQELEYNKIRKEIDQVLIKY